MGTHDLLAVATEFQLFYGDDFHTQLQSGELTITASNSGTGELCNGKFNFDFSFATGEPGGPRSRVLGYRNPRIFQVPAMVGVVAAVAVNSLAAQTAQECAHNSTAAASPLFRVSARLRAMPSRCRPVPQEPIAAQEGQGLVEALALPSISSGPQASATTPGTRT